MAEYSSTRLGPICGSMILTSPISVAQTPIIVPELGRMCLESAPCSPEALSSLMAGLRPAGGERGCHALLADAGAGARTPDEPDIVAERDQLGRNRMDQCLMAAAGEIGPPDGACE